MNRSDLVSALADKSGVSKKDADAVLTAFADVAGETLASGEKIQVPGFLTLERVERAARTAFNPRTREPIEVEAGYGVKLSAGAKLKSAVTGK